MLDQLVINHLIHNEPFMRKVIPYMRSDFFPTEGGRIIFGLLDTFINEYNDCPTVDALAVTLDAMNLNEHTFDQCVEVLDAVAPGMEQLDWLVDETEKWARNQAVYNAIQESVSAYQGDSEKGIEEIPELLSEALAISFDTDLGHDYWTQAGEHYDFMHNEDVKFPFGVDILNKATRGGIPNKTLNIAAAGINVGKTTWLIDRAAEWLEAGKNVVYFSFEVAENVIRHRGDVRLMDMPFDRVEAMTKQEYLGHVDKLKSSTAGKFRIKEYASGGAHIGHLRAFLKELEQKEDFKVDVICVDYLGEMASSRLPMHMMGNTNTYYGSVARELRSLAIEFDVPLWTAVQFTRDKQDSTDVSMSDTSESISIPKVADFMIALVQPDELALLNQARAIVMKNRYANKSKMKHFMIGLDNDRQKTYDLDWSKQSDVMTQQDIDYAKSVKLGNEPKTNGGNVNEWEM